MILFALNRTLCLLGPSQIALVGDIVVVDNQWCMSWYDLPSSLSHLFLPLSVPCPISVTFQVHPTSSACLLLPPLQLQGVLVQLCYVCAWTSLRLTLDLLRPDSRTKGYHLYTSYNLSDPFFIINNR